MPTYKALSVRQPDAWLQVNGIKTCENRSWNTKHRGTLVIHAGAKPMTEDDWVFLREVCTDMEIEAPAPDDLHIRSGGLVGAVYLAEVTATPDPDWEGGWWDGESLAWLLDGAQLIIEFVSMKGRLGLFDVELPFEITWKKSPGAA